MAVVTLQVGQCGNQLGSAWFSILADELAASPPSVRRRGTPCFFRAPGDGEGKQESGPPYARALLIDTEPKVVSNCFETAKRHGKWAYDPGMGVTKQSGSGNNWAHGYAVHGRCMYEAARDKVRKEVERCDHFGGFSVLQVIGGCGALMAVRGASVPRPRRALREPSVPPAVSHQSVAGGTGSGVGT